VGTEVGADFVAQGIAKQLHPLLVRQASLDACSLTAQNCFQQLQGGGNDLQLHWQHGCACVLCKPLTDTGQHQQQLDTLADGLNIAG
jgi:hypothetical protein